MGKELMSEHIDLVRSQGNQGCRVILQRSAYEHHMHRLAQLISQKAGFSDQFPVTF